MPAGSTLLLFLAAALVVIVIPGPSVLYVVARSIDQGRVAGVVSVLGISVGTLIHVVAAALGLSAVLVSSALVFSVVKYLGAAYLIYLGIRTLTTRHHGLPDAPFDARPLAQLFAQGVLINVLNPKTALFFFAFLPQFIDPQRGSVGPQILLLGAILVLLGACSDGMYALVAGSVGPWLRTNLGFLRVQRYVVGTVYIGLGVATAFLGTKNR